MWLTNKYCNKTDFPLASHRIANIAFTFDVKWFPPLHVFASLIKKYSYHPAWFYALYVQDIKGTIVVLQTGKTSGSAENVLFYGNLFKKQNGFGADKANSEETTDGG